MIEDTAWNKDSTVKHEVKNNSNNQYIFFFSSQKWPIKINIELEKEANKNS